MKVYRVEYYELRKCGQKMHCDETFRTDAEMRQRNQQIKPQNRISVGEASEPEDFELFSKVIR